MLQVVLEYERAVIFRLGQLLPGGAKGPGDMHWKTHKSAHSTSTRFLKLCGDFRPVYRSALYWILQKGWSPHHYTRCPATGGQRLFSLVLFLPRPVLFTCSFWQRTAWLCQWTPWSITACPTPSWAWQTWRTLITAQSRFFWGNISEFFMRWPFSRLLAQTSLRNILGTKNLHEILSDRDSIAGAMQVSPTQQLIFISQNKWFLTELAGRGHCRLGNKSGKSRNVRFTLLPLYNVKLFIAIITVLVTDIHLAAKMLDCLKTFNGPWQQRLRQPGRPEPR